jgi:5-formyltetrahydrofolate cyclo-ligase
VPLERRNLRERLRASRRAMLADECWQAALAVAARVPDDLVYAEACHIAGYWACQGELDPRPLLERAWATNKQVYLPVIVNDPVGTLHFAPYRPDSPLRPNRFNIPEPAIPPDEWLSPEQLDLVLVPLVAFDLAGTRLGMAVDSMTVALLSWLIQRIRVSGPICWVWATSSRKALSC